ncbi:hypothetical protein CHARACLAT_030389 [Characodon lateralis]|uniref:Uncharacterized protein n=1 Tax=Characodon lateralis TaxID=208331 RepID=A0ABU7EY37_9TELE|nr:hypothetical protein [Characodon lateralis]
MDQCDEDRVCPSKTALIGGHEVQRDEPEPDSKAEPEPDSQLSCMSLKSIQSSGRLIDFKSDEPPAAKRRKPEPQSEPRPSYVSFKSNKSTGRLIDFKSDKASSTKT